MAGRKERLLGFLVPILATAATLLLLEFVLRAALFSDYLQVTALRNARHFADSRFDEDFWKLHVMFGSKDSPEGVRAGYVDPVLGWTPARNAANPLGIIADDADPLSDLTSPVLFFGDSFVAGVTPMEEKIPQQLDELIEARTVLNLGVSGYGLDQIYLRVQKTLPHFRDPVVIVGVLTDDLDRSILGIRGGQKPRLEEQGGRLVVTNLPIEADVEDYVAKNPPRIGSYLYRLVIMRLRFVLPEATYLRLSGYDESLSAIKYINRRILGDLEELCRTLAVPLRVVIFYSGEEISAPNWRRDYLRSVLEELDVDYFDTRDYIHNYAAEHEIEPGTFYYDDGGHLNGAGNRVVAEGLRDWLTTGDGVLRPPASGEPSTVPVSRSASPG